MARKDHFRSGHQIAPAQQADNLPYFNEPNTARASEDEETTLMFTGVSAVPLTLGGVGKGGVKTTKVGEVGNVRIPLRHRQSGKRILGTTGMYKGITPRPEPADSTDSLTVPNPTVPAVRKKKTTKKSPMIKSGEVPAKKPPAK